MRNLFLISGLLLFFLAQNACYDTVIGPSEDTGSAYYPLQIGKFLEYQVDSIIFDDAGNGNTTDTLSSFVRETISGIDLDGRGDTIYLIERNWRQFEDDPWVLTNLFSASKNQFEAIRQEGNFRFLAISFPLSEDKRWQMTAFINPLTDVPIGSEVLEVYNFWNSEVIAYNGNGSVGSFQFSENNLTTIQHASNDEDPLHLRVVIEKYARDIGLVYKEMEILDSRCVRLGDPTLCLDQTWDEKAEKGFKLRQVLIRHN
jgi:hypothetical protein